MKSPIAHALLLASACTGLAVALPAGAQTMRPGLWSLTNNVSSSDPQTQQAMSAVQEHMANMTPEQRQQLQGMLRQNGVQLDIGAGGALQTKMCLTREMAERKEFPVQQGDCRQTFKQQSSTRGHVTFSCTRPKVSGEGDLIADSDTSYRAQVRMRSAEGGRNQTVDMNVTGTWLAADCGNLRPATAARAK